MKIPAIKELVEKYSIDQLQKAESDLEEGNDIAIEVQGEDEGEQLTHIIAAAWILQEMNKKNIEFKDALRAYTTMVRQSIS